MLRELLGVLPLDSLAPDGVSDSVVDSSNIDSAAAAGSAGTAAAKSAADTALPSADAPEEASPAAGAAAAAAAAARDNGVSPISSGAASSPPQQRPQELQLALPDGFHRLLVHGIAQFHGLARCKPLNICWPHVEYARSSPCKTMWLLPVSVTCRILEEKGVLCLSLQFQPGHGRQLASESVASWRQP